MPKKKYIPQQELNEVTDHQLLMQRQIILELICHDRFKFIKTYKDTDKHLFTKIKHILSDASKEDQVFIKNYFILPDKLKADFEINKSALAKNPHIYFLMNHDKAEYALTYAKILMKADGSFYKYLSHDLVDQDINIGLNAVISEPSVYRDLSNKYKVDDEFITKAIKGNPLVYCYLSDSHRANLEILKLSLEYALDIHIAEIFGAAPDKFKSSNTADLLQLLKLQPSIYKELSLKLRSDMKIATSALASDFNQIANVPQSMHFKLPVLDAYFSSSNLKNDVRYLVYTFKSETKRGITTSDLMNKLIAISPTHKMKLLAKIFGGGSSNYLLLNAANMTKLLKKSPAAFSNLTFLHNEIWLAYSDIYELAIKLDYKNFRYISYSPPRMYELDLELYEDLFKLAIKIYQANGSKGVHPYAYISYLHHRNSITQIKKIVTYKNKINGKVEVDYVNIFKHSPTNIKRHYDVYTNALNIDPKLAAYYPVTKKCNINIFNGLHLSARKALFDYWIKKQNIKDILEIAHLKNDILNPTTQSVVKVS